MPKQVRHDTIRCHCLTAGAISLFMFVRKDAESDSARLHDYPMLPRTRFRIYHPDNTITRDEYYRRKKPIYTAYNSHLNPHP
jgi:hypothetical protein